MNKPSAPIFYDPRWIGRHGIGRFAQEVVARIPLAEALPIAGPKLSPFDPLAISLALIAKRQGCYFSPGFNPPLASPIPICFTIHDLIHLKVPEESSAFRRLYYAAVVRPAARRAHCIFTVSEYSKREIAEWADVAEEKIVVASNAVASPFTSDGPRYQPGQPYFLHVGRRGAHKNIPRLLRAFCQSRSGKQACLLFTGDQDDATADCIHQLGMRHTVLFTGPLSDDALAAMYRGAEALLFPSLYEGFGLPIIEAMACGTPVITSDATATAEVAGKSNALLINPEDVAALSEAIDMIAYSSDLRSRLVKTGLARASFFSWDRTSTIIRDTLRSAT